MLGKRKTPPASSAVSRSTSSALSSSSRFNTSSKAVTLYNRPNKAVNATTEEELRESMCKKLRLQLQRVEYMTLDQLQSETDQLTSGYPDERRLHDDDKAWCNDQVAQAAASTEGRIYLLDAKNFSSSRTLIKANVDGRRIICPQLDATTYGEMLREQACDESLLHIRVVEGALGYHLSKAPEASIGLVFADYTGWWTNMNESGPKNDMINLLTTNKMIEDGKVFLTICLSRINEQKTMSVIEMVQDMHRVFNSHGWLMFTNRVYNRKTMMFVGFQRMA
jgi:hypothetical protein